MASESRLDHVMHKEIYYLAYNAFWIIIVINMIC